MSQTNYFLLITLGLSTMTFLTACSKRNVKTKSTPTGNNPVMSAGAEQNSLFRKQDLHVSLKAGPLCNGTEENPFPTLEAAREAIRQKKTAGTFPVDGLTVWIHGGKYMRDQSFELTGADSGTKQAPIVYRAVPGEDVRLIGGMSIAPEQIKLVADSEFRKRLPQQVADHVVEIDLVQAGIQHRGPFPDLFGILGSLGNGGIVDLYFNGKRLGLARWPNEGYTTMKEVLDSGDTGTKRPGTFVYRGNRPEKWSTVVDKGLWVAGFWRVPWVIQTIKVKNIDKENQTISHAVAVPDGIGSKYTPVVNGTRKGDGKEPWYVLNIPEELDLPGEWCIDFKTGKLYLYPPEEIHSDSLLISDFAQPIIKLDHTEYIQIRDVTIEGGLVESVLILGGRNNLIAGCIIRNTGGIGVVIKNGNENGIQSCDLYHLGAGGISITGGDRRALSSAANFAVNNHIHHFGEVTKIVNGIELSGVGNRLANNLIHDGTYIGVRYSGNNHIMEYNEIHNIGLDGGDLGGFYRNGDWAGAGNIMRYNLIHHAPGCEAFYMDDGASSDEIYNNISYKVLCGPFIGGGHNHKVHNNLSFQCEKGVHVDDRGVPRQYNKTSNRHYLPFKEFAEGSKLYQESYPGIERIPEENPEFPTGNLIENNVFAECKMPVEFRGNKTSFEGMTVKDNLILTGDSGFTDPEHLDCTLTDHAQPEAKQKLSWLQTHFPKMGLSEDEFRRSLPSAEATGRFEFRAPRQIFDSTKDVDASNRIEGKK